LEAAASRAREGVPCRVPALADSVNRDDRLALVSLRCGGQNCHVDVDFADGVTWIARIRLADPLLPPPATQARITLSEVATLQFLSQTKVPAPKVYAYSLESPENPVGVSYQLMEKLPGTPLDWRQATSEQQDKVMEQLADVYLQLEQHPLPLTGSLFPAPDAPDGSGLKVGPFAQVPCFESPEAALGPFENLEASYTTLIRQQLRALANREESALPVDNYLSFLWRLDMLPELVAACASPAGPFYLKHYDDKGDHILVDDDFNITGIIDWEFASAETRELAFATPCLMWPVREYYQGSNELAAEETRFAAMFDRRGRHDMGDLVRRGRRWQRYLFFLGGSLPRTVGEFESLFQGLRKSFAGVEGAAALSSYANWKREVLDRFAGQDAVLRDLLVDHPEQTNGR